LKKTNKSEQEARNSTANNSIAHAVSKDGDESMTFVERDSEVLPDHIGSEVQNLELKLPRPPTNKTKTNDKTRPTKLVMIQPKIEDLPYENPTFFRKLFRKINKRNIPEIVEIFTHILFEENVLIISDEAEDLLPVIFAIKSFLFPLKISYYSVLHDDEHEGYNNNLAIVNAPYVYFYGISGDDWDKAREFIEEDDKQDILVVKLKPKEPKKQGSKESKEKEKEKKRNKEDD
jgi:hypothetical protein